MRCPPPLPGRLSQTARAIDASGSFPEAFLRGLQPMKGAAEAKAAGLGGTSGSRPACLREAPFVARARPLVAPPSGGLAFPALAGAPRLPSARGGVPGGTWSATRQTPVACARGGVLDGDVPCPRGATQSKVPVSCMRRERSLPSRVRLSRTSRLRSRPGAFLALTGPPECVEDIRISLIIFSGIVGFARTRGGYSPSRAERSEPARQEGPSDIPLLGWSVPSPCGCADIQAWTISGEGCGGGPPPFSKTRQRSRRTGWYFL